MRVLRLVAIALALAAPTFGKAQTAQPVLPGYLATSGCPSAVLTPCFQPGIGGPASIGNFVGGFNAVVTSTPTVQNAAYSSGNALGTWQQIAAFRTTTQPSGILDYAAVWSKGGSTVAITIYGFLKSSANLTSTCTDKSAFVLAAADIAALIPGFPITLTPAAPTGATATTAAQSIVASVKNADGTASQNLTFCAVAGGSVTPATTSDLVFSFGLIQD